MGGAKPVHSGAPATAGRERRTRIGGWSRLLGGVAALGLFVFVLAPLGQRWAPLGRLGRVIAERDIEANAYFYTEVEAFAAAEIAVRNGRTYPSTGVTDEGLASSRPIHGPEGANGAR